MIALDDDFPEEEATRWFLSRFEIHFLVKVQARCPTTVTIGHRDVDGTWWIPVSARGAFCGGGATLERTLEPENRLVPYLRRRLEGSSSSRAQRGGEDSR